MMAYPGLSSIMGLVPRLDYHGMMAVPSIDHVMVAYEAKG